MRTLSFIGAMLFVALLVRVPIARADAVQVGSGIADGSGSGILDLMVDPKADPTTVADQLRSSLQLSSGATVESVGVENGIAHVTFANAAPGSTVEATLSTEIADSLGVGSPVAEEKRRRAAWIWGGGAAAVVTGGILGGFAAAGGGDEGGSSTQTPLSPTQ